METKLCVLLILVGAIAVAITPAVVCADEVTNLKAGTRVRATVSGLPGEIADIKRITGYFVSQDDTTITLTTGRSRSLLVIPRASMDHLERSVQPSRHGQGAAIGLAVGAGVGVVTGLASGDDPPGFFSLSAGDKAVIGAVVFGLAGTLIGAIAAPGEQWETVGDDRIQLGFSLGAEGETGFFISGRF